MAEVGPGPWLRLTALAATASTALVVASGQLGLAHRVLAAVALPPLAALVVAGWVAHRRLLAPAAASAGLFGLAALATAAPYHAAAAALALAASVVAAAATFHGFSPGRRGNLAVPPNLLPWSAAADKPLRGWRDYVTLTKPRIMSLLLLTGAAGMFVGAGGAPPAVDLAVLLAGLALACGGASALNHVLDRDIDRLMGKRTRRRPVAAGRVPASRALEFGLALSAFSFVLLASLANGLTALLALAGNLFYVLVYTRWLKRSTPQNIVIGGAAGAVPPLVGWAAATGNLTLPALALFLIVFVWTPPHFWALALLIRRDYEAAGVPMLPVVRGERETTRQILLYVGALVGVTLLPLSWHMFGFLYAAAALVLGGLFLALAWQLRRETTPRRAALLFHYSLAYLALLFVAMAVDPIVL
jgi:protoheme IX farnesyltransferase